MLHAVGARQPWVTYYAPGTAHAPHHAPKEWIAKFKGKFDMGWDKMREETLARQKAMGIVPVEDYKWELYTQSPFHPAQSRLR